MDFHQDQRRPEDCHSDVSAAQITSGVTIWQDDQMQDQGVTITHGYHLSLTEPVNLDEAPVRSYY
jgi:hypothetical protein